MVRLIRYLRIGVIDVAGGHKLLLCSALLKILRENGATKGEWGLRYCSDISVAMGITDVMVGACWNDRIVQ